VLNYFSTILTQETTRKRHSSIAGNMFHSKTEKWRIEIEHIH